jgi:hypothetical protein
MWVLTDKEQLTYVAFGLDMAFKPVFVPTLFFTDLAIPAESLEAFGLLLVGNGLWCPSVGAWHGWWARTVDGGRGYGAAMRAGCLRRPRTRLQMQSPAVDSEDVRRRSLSTNAGRNFERN